MNVPLQWPALITLATLLLLLGCAWLVGAARGHAHKSTGHPLPDGH